MKKERMSNIELLKVLSMIGVVVLHYNNAGIGKAFLYVPAGSMKAFTLYFLECVFISAVDVFMLISGYFMANSKEIDLRKPIRLLLQVIIFRECSYHLISGGAFNVKTFLDLLLPKSYFAVLYVAVYLVAPFVNRLMATLNRKSLNWLMATSFLLISVWPYATDVLEAVTKRAYEGLSTVGMYGSQSGYTFVNFMLMYMIGAYLRITDLRWKTWKSAVVLLGSWIVEFGFVCILRRNGIAQGLAWEYCNPIVIVSAVSSFLLFRNIRLKSNPVINSLAKATFSVYLLNATLLLNYVNTEKYVSGSGYLMLAHLAAVCVLICVFCWAAQCVYDLILRPVHKLMDQKLGKAFTFRVE